MLASLGASILSKRDQFSEIKMVLRFSIKSFFFFSKRLNPYHDKTGIGSFDNVESF